MKRTFALILISILTFSTSSQGLRESSLLNEEDWTLMKSDHDDGPALKAWPSSPIQWQSYNQWLCFRSSTVNVVVIPITYDGIEKRLPQVEAEVSGHLFQFAISADANPDVDELLQIWQDAIRNSQEICIYSAFHQKEPDIGDLTSSVWVLQRFKTENREWIWEPNARN